MPDIAKCKGSEGSALVPNRICPFRSSCWRYTSPDSEFRQAYFSKLPLVTDGGASTCDKYWDNAERAAIASHDDEGRE